MNTSRSATLSARGDSSMRSTTSSRGPRRILGQQLLDEARQAADDLVDEAQMRAVVHLFGARRRRCCGPRPRARAGTRPAAAPCPRSRSSLKYSISDCRFMTSLGADQRRREELDRLGGGDRCHVLGLEAEQPHARHDLAARARDPSARSRPRGTSVTSPAGAMVNSSTSLPCSSALSRSARAYRA